MNVDSKIFLAQFMKNRHIKRFGELL